MCGVRGLGPSAAAGFAEALLVSFHHTPSWFAATKSDTGRDGANVTPRTGPRASRAEHPRSSPPTTPRPLGRLDPPGRLKSLTEPGN